jgi:signal peptidase II
MTMRGRMTTCALLLVVVTTVGCDQVSKRFATVHLMGIPRQWFLGDLLCLEYAENPGAFLSLGAELPRWARIALIPVCTWIILVVCVVVALRARWPRLPLLGLAQVFAGGVSNLVDRVTRGSAVDFLNVGVGSLRTGIFNVAAMAIMLGIALLILGRRWRASTVGR